MQLGIANAAVRRRRRKRPTSTDVANYPHRRRSQDLQITFYKTISSEEIQKSQSAPELKQQEYVILKALDTFVTFTVTYAIGQIFVCFWAIFVCNWAIFVCFWAIFLCNWVIFMPLGNFCMLLGNFCMVFGIFACYWAIFTIVDKFYYWKLPNIQQIRKPSGHSADPKKTFLQSS